MRPIPGYEGLYTVSEKGEVRSLERQCVSAGNGSLGFRTVPSKILKPALKAGYPFVVLSKDGVKEQYLVHRLILLTFVGPAEGRVARHLDGNPRNCHLDNLAYGSQTDNYADAVRHGTLGRGERSPRAILTEKQVLEIRAAKKGIGKLAPAYGVSIATIEAIRSRRTWSHI